MFVTVNELMGLPGLPGTVQGLRFTLNKLAGDSVELMRRRKGTKAFEYHVDCLPEQAREIVRAKAARRLLASAEAGDAQVPVARSVGIKSRQELVLLRQCPALVERKVNKLTEKQKKIADARMVLAQEVLRLMDTLGSTRKAAVEFVATESQNGTLPERVQLAADIANARKGSTRRGVGKSSLQQWLSDYLATQHSGERLAIMAPGQAKKKEVFQYSWMPDFMRHWRDPNQPTVSGAYEKFKKEWNEINAGNETMLSMLPKPDMVRYALSKLPVAELHRGRVTGAEYKKYLPFVRRDWSKLPVNGVWVGDGHGMKMEVINPITGKPFKPEITLVIDARTRVVVGWSLAMSESQIAVGDAIRHGISQYGLPLMYYSDNGGGEKNRVFDAEITGIFSRLGIEHPTGIPGNPQGRGIIERLNQEIPKRAAMAFGSWVGKSGDRETQRKYRKAVDSAINAIEKGKELNQVQASAMRKVPTMRELVAEIESQVERHNNRPHSSLPERERGKHWSPLAYRNHVIKQEEEEIQYLTNSELHEMFRPEEICTARRGEIQLFKNLYFSTELACVEGEKVRVCYDIHDPNTVIVRRMDGSWICDAIWNGNKVDAFPKARIDQLKEKRVKNSVKNLEDKVRRKKEEIQPVIEQKPEIDLSLFSAPQINKEPEKVYLFESEREYDLKKAGNHR
ncbi:Mu transposase C-terminal domain-containing protein [Pantoea sp. BAV 3049]|uniref:Mu transposase C-terminal domain-containing protein n=1 Tax=Pantoea sp. BAV 3049 TaxID=2654188 RepID=UPI00131C6FD9|nr:Mu transposase C-terminal domain-containing protein [Pantoea sp. BAV 3049]